MNPLSDLLALPEVEQQRLGVVHTAREIAQQPDTWSNTYERIGKAQSELLAFLTRANVFDGKDKPTVYLVGAGTSDYVGRSVAPVLRRQWQCDVWPVPSTDMLTNFDELHIKGKSYLWISFSRSGDSSEGVATLETALQRRPDVQQLIVCCNQAGQMVQVSNGKSTAYTIVLADDVNDQGLAMTSSYSNMVVAGQCLAHIRHLESYQPTLDSLIASGRDVLPTVAEIAAKVVGSGFNKICFLGTGSLFGVAVESALKVTELTAGGIGSFGDTFLGVRHGPLSAIDSETLVVGLVSTDRRTRGYEIDLLKEIKAKSLAKNILILTATIAAEDREQLRLIGETLTFVETVDDLYRPPVDVFLGQLIGLLASLKLGLKPDAPSPHGAISRVVSKVRIY
jgi:tagatose-6-phosphate ketose/aldose isomerase